MDMKQRYWRLFVELSAHSCYIDLYHEKTERIDWWINALLAVSSSTSIGGWAIFREYAFVWGAIIATSQVVGALKELLPFKKRLRALSGLSHDLARLLILAEDGWFDVSRDRLDDAQIQKKMSSINTQVVDLKRRHFDGQSLPRDAKLLYRAEQAAASHFERRYGVRSKGSSS